MYIVLLAVLLAGGVYLRFEGLGLRSLWRDELCTWHVSRMEPAQSLRWGPELTKPPLYQFALRALTGKLKPSEWELRLPAAVCGALTLLSGVWLGYLGGGWSVGVALAGLLAFQRLQIFYSQEARPYSMMVLGCTVATALWIRLVTTKRTTYFWLYVAAAVLTLYAHYLAVLTFLAHAIWWVVRRSREPTDRRSFKPFGALVLTGLLCIPLALRYLAYRTSMFQGLEWVSSPTWATAFEILGQLTFGWRWIAGLLTPVTLLWIAGMMGYRPRRLWRPGGVIFHGRDDPCGVLMLWFLCSWLGLLVISWLAHPAMVARYALPACVPAVMLPLVVIHRLDRRAPLIVMAVFIVGAVPEWTDRQVDPGLREMVAYLEANVNPETEFVVQTLDETVYPGWEDSERIVFDYYPIENITVHELRLEADGVTPTNDVLSDPRGFYLIVLWADPFPILRAAGRATVPIVIEGKRYGQLSFPPYRLLRVAPIAADPQRANDSRVGAPG